MRHNLWLLVVVLTCMVSCSRKPVEFTESGNITKSVTIPLSNFDYVDIDIDCGNLLMTNELTVWEFEGLRIARVGTDPKGNLYEGDVYYISNNKVYRKYGDYYIVVSGDNVLPTVKCMLNNDSYEVMAILDSATQIKELPEMTSSVTYTESGWNFPLQMEKVLLGKSSDDRSYYSGEKYLNYNFRYMKFSDAKNEAVSRVVAMSHDDIDWYYVDDNLFLVKAGEEYVCIKQRDYTSCYFISSNELDFVLMNL